jgi:hypothetical protein
MTEAPKDSGSKLLEGSFSGPVEFSQLIRDALKVAARDGWADMVWSDADFAEWPLREREVIESLNAWARTGRKLLLLAKTYDVVIRHQARMVSWRTQWDHIVECRVCKNVDSGEFFSGLWSPVWAMQRGDLVRSTGFSGYESARRVRLKEVCDEYRRHSSPGFPATTLGL